ncbi:hypothetical protein BJ165DRAFT_124368 [Panaeolus papilionaceus]|nr:hypothetical protein BJ165DRAFT_124368 [Panaeolus papilionaceus]
MGPTGIGKSNVFCPELDSEAHGHCQATLSRETHIVEVYGLLNHPKWKDRKVLVDTPGSIDEFLTEYAVLKKFREWMAKSNVAQIDRLTMTIVSSTSAEGQSGLSHETLQQKLSVEVFHAGLSVRKPKSYQLM